MKILFLAIKGIEHIGGIETYTREIGHRLVQNGHEVIVYCLKTNSHSQPYTYQGMTIIPLPALRHKTLTKLSLVFLASLHQFKLREVDIVHYHAIGPSMFCFIPRLIGRKTVVQSHGHEWKWNRSGWNKLETLFFQSAEKLSFIFASAITAVSKELQNDYLRQHNRTVTYIPNGVNDAQILPAKQIKILHAEEKNYILFLGRISREKGVHYLIEAYQQLDTSLQLVIVGQQREGDNYLSELHQLADGNPRILFPGIATGDLWREWYSNAAIFVLPSETEGMPISLLEAMSFGNCCLTSNIPPNLEALGDAGTTFESMNVNSLTEALAQLIDNPEKRKEYGQAARTHVYHEYTWESITQELELFYQQTRGTTLYSDTS